MKESKVTIATQEDQNEPIIRAEAGQEVEMMREKNFEAQKSEEV